VSYVSLKRSKSQGRERWLLVVWDSPTDEDPVEKGCLGEGQTRSNVKFPALPPPVFFEALSPSCLRSGGRRKTLAQYHDNIFTCKEIIKVHIIGQLSKELAVRS